MKKSELKKIIREEREKLLEWSPNTIALRLKSQLNLMGQYMKWSEQALKSLDMLSFEQDLEHLEALIISMRNNFKEWEK